MEFACDIIVSIHSSRCRVGLLFLAFVRKMGVYMVNWILDQGELCLATMYMYKQHIVDLIESSTIMAQRRSASETEST